MLTYLASVEGNFLLYGALQTGIEYDYTKKLDVKTKNMTILCKDLKFVENL